MCFIAATACNGCHGYLLVCYKTLARFFSSSAGRSPGGRRDILYKSLQSGVGDSRTRHASGIEPREACASLAHKATKKKRSSSGAARCQRRGPRWRRRSTTTRPGSRRTTMTTGTRPRNRTRPPPPRSRRPTQRRAGAGRGAAPGEHDGGAAHGRHDARRGPGLRL